MITVQIIDDNIPAATALKEYLNMDPDIKVINISSDGKKGRDNYLRLKPDVLLLDLQLPSMDGSEILDYLCKHTDDKKRGNNVIAISSYFEKYRFKYTTKLHSCIPKPFESLEVKERIKEVYKAQQISHFDEFIKKCRASCYDIMTDLCLKPSNEQTQYLIEAVIYVIENQKTSFVLNDICEKLSIKFNKSERIINWNLVRAMRTLNKDCTIKAFKKVFPNYTQTSITLKQLISLIANKLDPEHSYSEHTHCLQ